VAYKDDDALGGHFWKWFLGVGLLAVAGFVLIVLLIHGSWVLVVAWFYDRRQVKDYEEL